MRVLIIDDIPIARTMLKDMLTLLGHEVVAEAENEAQAIEAFKTHKPELITLDLGMGENVRIDVGLSLLTTLRTLGAKVLVISGNAQDHTRAKVGASGACGFVTKPVSILELKAAIQHAGEAQPMKVLVIDDSKTMRHHIAKSLGEMGFTVREAGTGEEGLSVLIGESRWAAVIVDLNMPEMHGFDFIQAVRAIQRFKTLPIVVATADTEFSVIKKAMEIGANEYIMKPFRKEALQEKFALLQLASITGTVA